MSSAEKYAQWIVNNQDKKGTEEFDVVVKAYKAAKAGATSSGSVDTYKGLPIVKHTADGGIILRMPNGKLTYVNEQAGYSTSDPQKIEQMMGGQSLKEQLTESFDKQTLEQSPIAAHGIKFVEGLPFVGSHLANLTPEAKLAKGAMERQKPMTSAALEVAGGVVGSAPLALAAPASLPSAISGHGVKGLLGLGAVSAAGGAAEGAIYGAGEDNVLGGAATGAVGGLVGSLLGTAFAKAYNVFKQSKADKNAYKQIAKNLDISEDAAKVIAKVWGEGKTDPMEAVSAIRRAGERGMIADADAVAANLLDATKAAGTDAIRVADAAVSGRVSEQSADVMASLEKGLGKTPVDSGDLTMDLDSMVHSIYSQTADARGKAYGEALNTIIDYSTPQGRRIEQVFNEVIPERFTKKAYEKTLESMRINEKDTRQLLAALKPDGSIDISRLPDMRTLDELKKTIGNMAFEKNEFGQYTADAVALQPAYYKLRDAIGGAVPAYKEAVKLGGDTIAQKEALQTGMDAFKRKVTPMELSKNIAQFKPAEREMVKKGARIALDDTMSQVKKSIAGLNAGYTPDQIAGSIEEVAKLWKDLSSRNSRNKVAVLMGKQAANQFYDEMEKLQVAYALKAALAVNSKTATRLLTDQAISDITSVGPLGNLLRGEPAQATKRVIQEVTGLTDDIMDARKQSILTDVAKGLTQKKGKEARQAAVTILKLVSDKQVSDAELNAAYNAIMAGIPMAATAGATQVGELVTPEL